MDTITNSPHTRTMHPGFGSLARLWAGLTVEMTGIVIAGFGFTFRDDGIPLGGIQLAYWAIGVIAVFVGMFLALAGAIVGLRTAQSRQRMGYGIAVAAGIGQIAGLIWDNILHASGQTHFIPAHTLAITGLVALLVTAIGLALTRPHAQPEKREPAP